MEQQDLSKIHIAEMFDSVQGEGLYTGTRMFFIRLAGCTVGKPFDKALAAMAGVPDYVEQCTLYDGRKFLCDTNYRRASSMYINELVNKIPSVEHVSITGGEPFAQRMLLKLVDALIDRCMVHIETSGTINTPWIHTKEYNGVWITVSPKAGVLREVLQRANEVKILVDKDFKLESTLALRGIPTSTIVWLQPVNNIDTIDRENLVKCMEILQLKPTWRLSVQLHKYLEVR